MYTRIGLGIHLGYTANFITLPCGFWEVCVNAVHRKCRLMGAEWSEWVHISHKQEQNRQWLCMAAAYWMQSVTVYYHKNLSLHEASHGGLFSATDVVNKGFGGLTGLYRGRVYILDIL